MKIAIDLDGVLANIHNDFIAAVYRLKLNDTFITGSEPDNAPALYTPQDRRRLWDSVLSIKNIYQYMGIYHGEVASLRKFLEEQDMRDFTIYYMTRRRQDAGASVMYQTSVWLNTFGLSNPSTSIIILPPTFTRTKLEVCNEMGVDYLLDDSIKNLLTANTVKLEGIKTKGYLLVRPWNKEHLWDYEFVVSMEQFLDKVKESK